MRTKKKPLNHSLHRRLFLCLVLACGLLPSLVHCLPLHASSSSPIQISLPHPLASGPQPVTIKSGLNHGVNSNDVIGYIVVPYPGSGGPVAPMTTDPRTDLTAAAATAAAMQSQPYFSLLGPSAATPYAGLGRNYRRLRNPYAPLMYNPLAYSAFPGYGSLYGYTPRVPFFNLLG